MKTENEIGNNNEFRKSLFNNNVTFLLGVTQIQDLPEDFIPEVAFFGRSNVGKSSLLNSITNKNKLAFTSKSPGRTRELNFFSLKHNDKTLINIVDMPGYGFAKASKEQIKKWTKLSDNYLKSRKNLRRVFLLIDARRSIMPVDINIMDIMDNYAVSYQIVLTKIDKILEVENLTELVFKEIEKRKADFPNILITSSKKKYGVNEIKNEIISLID